MELTDIQYNTYVTLQTSNFLCSTILLPDLNVIKLELFRDILRKKKTLIALIVHLCFY